ncbi:MULTISPECIES: hypothetical protein [Caballeronia]|uniref:Uncharacterized protein n=3 Tax=Caballeronia TaxID=1827195 RepID=A0AA37IC37_9BURK|nr:MULTISPECIES: hypothetical protein [Caballeronia]MBC8638887.1 hypothetical protein [Caballeronia sp. EK]GJH10777.1 hypothetical protein CBA19CS11_18085 [Caballeronia novacaledonica]GJH20348.1 hypothetical protein CBA19CS22_27420 [Caballeronia novacaledonica]GJH27130.1 hypothetical protein CBA19CS42_21460 [Caballeronia novacaledonica]
MTEDPNEIAKQDAALDEIVKRGPSGAIALAGISTAIVIGLWFVFYFAVFLPRGVIQ